MYHGVDYFIVGLNSLVVITSLLFALSQYFEKHYQSRFASLKEEVEKYDFPVDIRESERFKKKKEVWERLLNLKPPSAKYLVVFFFILLLFLILGMASLWTCNLYYLWAGPMMVIMSWSLCAGAIWCAYIIYALKTDFLDARKQADDLEEALEVMHDTRALDRQ